MRNCDTVQETGEKQQLTVIQDPEQDSSKEQRHYWKTDQISNKLFSVMNSIKLMLISWF